MKTSVERTWVTLGGTGVSHLTVLMDELPSALSGFSDCGDKPYCEVVDGRFVKCMKFDADRWHERFLDENGHPVYCAKVTGYFRKNPEKSYLPRTFYVTREFAQEILSDFDLPFHLMEKSDPNDAEGSLYLRQIGAEDLVGTMLSTKFGKTIKILEHSIGGWHQEVFKVETKSGVKMCDYRDLPAFYRGTPQEEYHKELYALLHT